MLTFEEGAKLLKQCYDDSGKKWSDSRACGLRAIKNHFNEIHSDYYHHDTIEWIADNQLLWSKSKVTYIRRTAYELNDVIVNGSLSGVYRYRYYQIPYDLQSEYWKEILNRYYEDMCQHITHRCAMKQLRHCSFFVGFLSKSGIEDATLITVAVISKYHKFAITIGDTYNSIYSVRYFLEFLVNNEFIPLHRPFSLTSPLQAKAAGYAVEYFQKSPVVFEDGGMLPSDFLNQSVALVNCLKKEFHHNEDALRNNYTAFFQMFYVFISEENISYTYKNALLWIEGMYGFFDHQKDSAAKRSFYLLDRYLSAGEISITDVKFKLADKGRIQNISQEYRELLLGFIAYHEKANISKSTLTGYKNGALSLLEHLQNRGIFNISEVSYDDIKEYCIYAAKASSDSRNHYMYDNRVFLKYCFEKEYTVFDLSLSLPMQSGQKRKIIKVLSEDDVQAIYDYRDKAATPVELRDSAILMLGLLMGLRRIDVVNLKLSDIDWKNQSISIVQQKTYRPLVLPMPVSVGNSIYRYIKAARPAVNSETDYIFLSMVAPYKKAHTSACSIAVKHALGKENGSFHMLRRTFASRLLSAGTNTDTIKDSLGHSSMDTVSRYLSIDDEMLRKCCLPLERTVINDETTA